MTPQPWAELVARANADARQPVLFIAAPGSAPMAWAPWVEAFEAAGYAALTPDWPSARSGEPSADAVSRATLHFAGLARALSSRPAIVGYGLGALVAQLLAVDGLSAATVSIGDGASSPADQRALMLIAADAFGQAMAEDALAFIQRFV